MLQVQRLQLELIRNHLRFLVPRIARHDKRLAEQLRNAANSSGLNTDEGLMARGGNRPARLNLAEDEAREASRALKHAWAWGYLEDIDVAVPLELLDRIRAILWRLRHQ